MGMLRTLLWRELLERRALLLTLVVALSALNLSVSLVWLEPGDEFIAARYLLPAILGLAGSIWGADLGARDRERRYDAWLYRLPLGALLLWLAKVTVLAGGFACLSAAVLGSELAWRSFANWPVAEWLSEVERFPFVNYTLGLLPVLAWSLGLLLGRALPAAVLAPILGIGLPLAVLELAEMHSVWNDALFTLSLIPLSVWAVALFAGFLFASGLVLRNAVRQGRRGAMAFLSGLAIVLLPAFGVAYHSSKLHVPTRIWANPDSAGENLILMQTEALKTWRGTRPAHGMWSLSLDVERGPLRLLRRDSSWPSELDHLRPAKGAKGWWVRPPVFDEAGQRVRETTLRWKGHELPEKNRSEGHFIAVPSEPRLVVEWDRPGRVHRTWKMGVGIIAEWPTRVEYDRPHLCTHAPLSVSGANQVLQYRNVRTGELLSSSHEDLLDADSSHEHHLAWTSQDDIFAVSRRRGFNERERSYTTTQFTFHGPDAPPPFCLKGDQALCWVDSERVVTWDVNSNDAIILRSLDGQPVRTLWERR